MIKPRRLAAAAAGLALLAAAGGACSDDESVFNAEVGECLESVSELVGTVSELPETDCTTEHGAEIFFLVEHEGDDDDFPGTSDLQSEAAEECEGDGYEDYMGVEFGESEIVVQYVTPSEESWGGGDRETICVAALFSGESVDESFEGNGDEYPVTGDLGAPEDTSLEDFADDVDACQDGDMEACDDLYAETPFGSEAEAVALECGGEDPGGDHQGDCAAEFG